MAFIAIDEATDEMLGVVRLHLDDDRQGGEYAVIVRSALKGHGLGWLLMQRMIEYARAIGLKRVHGQVLAENTTMLRMCADLGFPHRGRSGCEGDQGGDADIVDAGRALISNAAAAARPRRGRRVVFDAAAGDRPSASDLLREAVDLLPLLGHGLVQILDDPILMGDARSPAPRCARQAFRLRS